MRHLKEGVVCAAILMAGVTAAHARGPRHHVFWGHHHRHHHAWWSRGYHRTHIVDQLQSNVIARYCKQTVPARILINHAGIPVRSASTTWSVVGSEWDRVRIPAVFIQTRRVVSPQFDTLVPGPCAP